MVSMENAVIARMEKFGKTFEILVDPDLAMDVKHGKEIPLSDLLAVETIFKDSKKGDEQSPEAITEAFETQDLEQVVKKIIQHGSVQLTTEQRRKFLENKRNEIITFIAKNGINPQNNTPHPPQRIENAMEEAKITIDAFKSTEEQIKTIVDEIKKIIPISMDKVSFAVKIPAQYSGKASSIIHKFEIKKEEWLNDGSLLAEFTLPSGMKQDLLNELNSATHGDIIVKIEGEKI